MARPAGATGERTAAAIQGAALELIYLHGYEGFGLRALASAVGLRPASLYNHFASKQTLLAGLITLHLEALLASAAARLAQSGPAPLDLLKAFSAHHLEYHLDKKMQVHVANAELRSLTGAHHAAAVALRRRYEALLIGILEAGMRAGVVQVADVRLAAYAVIAMLTGATAWYRPNGRLSRRRLVDLHVRMALDACGVRGRAAPVSRATHRMEPIHGI